MVTGTLLHAYVVPLLVGKRGGHLRVLNLVQRTIDYFAVTVRRSVRFGIGGMLVERTTADVEVADDDLLIHPRKQSVQLLLDGICRETVADGKDFNDLRLCGCRVLRFRCWVWLLRTARVRILLRGGCA